MQRPPSAEETGYTLSQAGRERHFGVRAPVEAIERAMRVLVKRRVVRLTSDDSGIVWYRLRGS